MQWWCSAQGVSWTWQWQAYPGVWIFIAALCLGYTWMVRTLAPSRGETRGRERLAFVSAVLVLWLALDWPIGPLGAGYLASVHMVQYLAIGIAAPALLLLAIPREAAIGVAARPRLRRFLRAVTFPGFTLATFIIVTVATHLPQVVDPLMRSQMGSFVFDMIWLVAGLLFWWPVIAPIPVRPELSPPVGILYLFPSTLIHTAISAFLVFSRFPIYSVYELAPPTGWVSAIGDQQIAGGLMWVLATPIVWSVIGVVFFRWMRESEASEAT